jgi:hypothetical protein
VLYWRRAGILTAALALVAAVTASSVFAANGTSAPRKYVLSVKSSRGVLSTLEAKLKTKVPYNVVHRTGSSDFVLPSGAITLRVTNPSKTTPLDVNMGENQGIEVLAMWALPGKGVVTKANDPYKYIYYDGDFSAGDPYQVPAHTTMNLPLTTSCVGNCFAGYIESLGAPQLKTVVSTVKKPPSYVVFLSEVQDGPLDGTWTGCQIGSIFVIGVEDGTTGKRLPMTNHLCTSVLGGQAGASTVTSSPGGG